MTELSQVYCRPQTDEEWDKLLAFDNDYISAEDRAAYPFIYWSGNALGQISDPFDGLTEIPVSRFIDLLQDRIVPWRLEEMGFDNDNRLFIQGLYLCIGVGEISNAWMDVSEHHSLNFNITPFTELQQLIKFLTAR